MRVFAAVSVRIHSRWQGLWGTSSCRSPQPATCTEKWPPPTPVCTGRGWTHRPAEQGAPEVTLPLPCALPGGLQQDSPCLLTPPGMPPGSGVRLCCWGDLTLPSHPGHLLNNVLGRMYPGPSQLLVCSYRCVGNRSVGSLRAVGITAQGALSDRRHMASSGLLPASGHMPSDCPQGGAPSP